MPSPLSSQIHLQEGPSPSERPADHTYLIYYITGNPGLIGYYNIFLTHLYGLLTQKDPFNPLDNPFKPSFTFQIYGRSLSGFEVDGQTDTKSPGRRRKQPPYGLQDQIAHSEDALEQLVGRVKKEGSKDVRVILMGHSVGSYILLEMIRRLREKVERRHEEGVRVVGGVCLFPTVTHIARSPSGRKSSWLLNLRPFARVASMLAKALTLLVPTSFLALLIRASMSFPSDAARATAAFVRSRYGVRQALHMARDEMQQITTDAWDADIWGAAHPSQHPHPRPILRFLFAKQDHWVADETRDDLIKARGVRADAKDEVEEWKPLMEVDEEEAWPHGFCIRHSVPVAERVYGYVKDIVESDMARE